MFKVLLVDDEPLMRVALQSMLDWEAYSYSVCGTAANGEDALHLIEKHKPELVITDLKMPRMDGISLIREIQIRGYACKILVISNYSDFELVREALKLGAVDYLLKLDMDEASLAHQLEQVRLLLEKDRSNQEIEFERTQLMDSQKKKQILRDFFSSDVSDPSSFLLGNFDCSFSFSNSSAAMFYIILENGPADTQAWVDFGILENVVADALSQAELPTEIFSVFPSGIVVMTPVANCSLRPFSSHLQNILQTYVASTCTVLYTNSFLGYQQAKEKFSCCKTAHQIRFYKESSIIDAESIHFSKRVDAVPPADFARELLRNGRMQGPSAAEDMWIIFSATCCADLVFPAVLRTYLIQMFESLSMLVCAAQAEHPHDAHQTINTILNEISQCNSFSSLSTYVVNALPKIFFPAHIHKEVIELIDYINLNYAQKLSLKKLAEHVYLNESYICRIFKEDTGTSIINYINSVRMEHAAKLLKSGAIPPRDICDSIGIDTPSYFYRLFKSYFGVSPSQFLKKNDTSTTTAAIPFGTSSDIE